MTTRVKICGITSVEDALQAVEVGVDAIGLVFYSKSPRVVTPETAREICRSVGPYVTTVGLFVNATEEEVRSVLSEVPLQVLQFHGDEQADFCRQFERPWYKAIRMSPELDPAQEMACYPGAVGYLFDAWNRDKYGGTGETFDWQRVPESDHAMVLAGGLNPDNIAEAISVVKPYAVDVSGGVENAPGKKDKIKMQRFVANAKSVQF